MHGDQGKSEENVKNCDRHDDVHPDTSEAAGAEHGNKGKSDENVKINDRQGNVYQDTHDPEVTVHVDKGKGDNNAPIWTVKLMSRARRSRGNCA